MSVLLNSISYKVQENLVAARLLSVGDIRNIKTESTTKGQNVKMYQMVLSRVKSASNAIEVRKSVCKGLCESAQYCPFSQQESPATEIQKETITNLRPRLLEDAEVDPVLDRLTEERLMDFYQRELVRAEKTRRDRVDALLEFISHTHSRGHDTFMEILRITNWWIFKDDTQT